ncbi:lipoxygenase family protein [Archangium sp.]|uniref:lipoxygenase family protein n=1 Tax=Archangium sp. TaxID=1872627 RepID=UPI002D602856|nr:lipoxygenase family protein [Archangium sp.]HYO53407.1 lipoxygenase family protein [Archangium sp.]
MNLFNKPVLPQNDTPDNRKSRAQTLVQKQTQYVFDYPAIVAGLPMAAAPIPVDISIKWGIQLAEMVIQLGENLVDVILPNLFSFDVQIPTSLGQGSTSVSTAPIQSKAASLEASVFDAQLENQDIDKREVLEFQALLGDAREELAELAHNAHARKVMQTPEGSPSIDSGHDLVKTLAHAEEAVIAKAIELDAKGVEAWLSKLARSVLEFFLKSAGIYGRAMDLQNYDAQFRKVALPWTAGVFQTDEVFAALRVAGPNAGILQRATLEDVSGFLSTDEQFLRVTGEQRWTRQEAVNAGHLYLVDYRVLTQLEPGTSPQQKYVFAPKALFLVPRVGSGRGSLRPLAIKSGQDADSPVFYPEDGLSWSLAKTIVNIADGNYHELISHLGLTHLLTEPFVLATERQLDPQHPLYVLLKPHFAGTLFINYKAQTSLIVQGGPVDLLLAGTSASSNQLAANAVKSVRYNQSFFPEKLARQGIGSPEELPDYPYRDDALALWRAIHGWVSEYASIYYSGDEDVAGDYELQAWVQELVNAGHIQDIGEGAPGEPARISTLGYLCTLLTQVIFVASVEHAAVNFPQRTMMSYTPAIPLAGFAPFPASATEGAEATQLLDLLPPLNESILQQALMVGLGGVHYTVLGQYGGELSDPRALLALLKFQRTLQSIEKHIQAANTVGGRTLYTTLLPSAIPQSINI